MKISQDEIDRIENELNWCSIMGTFYQCKANKSTDEIDQQAYSAKENYFDGRVDSYLRLFRMCGLNIENYQELHHKIEGYDFTATEYKIIND